MRLTGETVIMAHETTLIAVRLVGRMLVGFRHKFAAEGAENVGSGKIGGILGLKKSLLN